MSHLLTPDDYLDFPVAAPDICYRYGALEAQYGALYLPEPSPPHAVIVLIHGGCYRELYDLKPISGLARELTRDGFAVWNIEYRRSGNGGAYPGMFQDVAAAVDSLRFFARRHALDLERVFSVGHSAGGHLALWLAVRRKLDQAGPLYRHDPLPIAGVVALAAIAEVSFAVDQGLCADDLLAVMGGAPDAAPDHYRALSPAEMLPLGVKQAHVVGAEDEAIRANVERYAAQAEAHGDDLQLVVVPDAGHFEIVCVEHPAWQVTRRMIRELA